MILFTPRLSRLSHSTHHLLVLIVEDFVSKVGTFVDGARGTLVVVGTRCRGTIRRVIGYDYT
jgi:hypothetical protein